MPIPYSDAAAILLPHAHDRTIRILFDYPMAVSVVITFETNSEWTMSKFLAAVHAGYRWIYDLEHKTATDQPVPLSQRKGLLNRNATDGLFQIYGHDLDDLWLEGLAYNKADNLYTLGIGS